ncbi:hypothetical protein [Kitasatospora sp. McL0602]|uniref:hypothetical protein n=1 Tax=Kitasatospora sp. McL0602 TaxID=3439530 RepID=UPI003F89DD14
MSIRDNLDIIDRVATAIESKMYRIHEPAPETAEAREVRLKAETAANRRVANEVPAYCDTLPSLPCCGSGGC